MCNVIKVQFSHFGLIWTNISANYFHYFPWICPELPRTLRNSIQKKRCIEMSLFLYGNSPEMRETEGKICGKNLSMEMWIFMYGNSAEMRETEGKFCGKNLCMEMSLFLCGNSAEMRATEGNFAAKKQRHGNEFISVRNSGKKIMYANIFIYASLIGNGTWKNGRQHKIQAILEISGGHNCSWPRIFN